MTALDGLVGRRSQTKSRLVRRLAQKDGLVQQPISAQTGPHLKVGSSWILNFTSTNYLGFGQDPRVINAAARATRNWGISLGMPRLFAHDRLTARLEKKIARMVGQQGALVYPSTTHIALDVIPLLAGGSGLILVDERAYPISLEGVNAAACRGARILRFPHNDFRALERALEDNRRFPDKVIVCDGVYPAGGYQAPLNEYSNLGRVHDAVLYVDDAHGFGLVGERPTRAMPFGTGGGGTPKHQNITGGNLVHVGGFSKAFGVPVAFVAGPRGFIDYLRDITSTYTHSSPPAIPNLAAALAVVRLNSVSGDANRRHLVEKVRLFRNRLKQYDISLTSDPFFPVQTLWFDNPSYTEVVARKLRQNGIWVVLQLWPAEHPNGAAIRFVITAQHSRADIDAAATRIAQCLLSFPSVEKGFASS